MNKDKRDLLIIGIILTALIVGGLCIWESRNLNEYIEANQYVLGFELITTDFNSSSGEVIHINGFVFYYDFTNNHGNISFDLNNKNWSIDYIRIEFPSVVDNDSLKIYTKKNGDKLNINLTKKKYKGDRYLVGHKCTHLTLSDFDRTFYDETFVIEFKSNLKPKGLFTFLGSDKNYIHSGSQNANVNFILGDNYECRGSCVSKLQNIEETIYSVDRDLQLDFKRKKAKDTCAFQLGAVSRKILFRKSLLLGLGIAFLVAGISFVLERLYKYLREKDG